MTELRPCGGCLRHVRVDEVACPFCAASLGAPGASRVVPVSLLTRAAVFAFAGAALAATAAGAVACGGSQPKTENGLIQNVPPDAGPANAAATPDAEVVQPDQKYIERDNSCCMPYGAPPAQARLV